MAADGTLRSTVPADSRAPVVGRSHDWPTAGYRAKVSSATHRNRGVKAPRFRLPPDFDRKNHQMTNPPKQETLADRPLKDEKEYLDALAAAYREHTDLSAQQVQLRVTEIQDDSGTIIRTYRYVPKQVEDVYVISGDDKPVAVLPPGTSREVAADIRSKYRNQNRYRSTVLDLVPLL